MQATEDPRNAPYLEQIRSARMRRDQRIEEVMRPLQGQADRLRLRLGALLGCVVILSLVGVALIVRSTGRPPATTEGPQNAILRWAAERQLWAFLTHLTRREWAELSQREFDGSVDKASDTHNLTFEEQLALFRRRFVDESEQPDISTGSTIQTKDSTNIMTEPGLFKCSIDKVKCPANVRPSEGGPYRSDFISQVALGFSLSQSDCEKLSSFLNYIEKKASWRASEAESIGILHLRVASCYRDKAEWDQVERHARIALCVSDLVIVDGYAILHEVFKRRRDQAQVSMAAKCAEEAARYVYDRYHADATSTGLTGIINNIGVAGVLHCRNGDLQTAERLVFEQLLHLKQNRPRDEDGYQAVTDYLYGLMMSQFNLVCVRTGRLSNPSSIIPLLAEIRASSVVTDTSLLQTDLTEAIWRIRLHEFSAALPVLRRARERFASLPEILNETSSFEELHIGIEQDTRSGVAELNRQALSLVDVLEGKQSARKLAQIDGVLAWLSAQLSKEGKTP